MRLKQKIYTWIVPVCALGGAWVGVSALLADRPKSEVTAPRVLPPRQPAARPGDSASRPVIGATGTIESASRDIAVASVVPGVVARVLVDAGDPVRAGDPLFEIDTRALRAELDQRQREREVAASAVGAADAAVAEAAAIARDRRAQADRAATLLGAAAISRDLAGTRAAAADAAEAQLVRAKAEAKRARALVAQAESAVSAARVALDRALVRAPIDGTILQAAIRPGEFAPADGSGRAAMVIGKVRPLHLRVDVDEADIPRLAPGAPATFSVRGGTGRWNARFVRAEPLLVGKRNLAGVSGERVDTRVLQLIFAIEDAAVPAFVGQQVDVFLPARG